LPRRQANSTALKILHFHYTRSIVLSGAGRDHLARAAFLADCRRASEESLLALALPPLSPPSLPRATAEGFLRFFGEPGSPVSKRPISCARSLVSRESFFGSIMPPLWHGPFRCPAEIGAKSKMSHYLPASSRGNSRTARGWRIRCALRGVCDLGCAGMNPQLEGRGQQAHSLRHPRLICVWSTDRRAPLCASPRVLRLVVSEELASGCLQLEKGLGCPGFLV